MSQLAEHAKPASPQLAHYTAEYQRAIAQGPTQPRWLSQARNAAMAEFERLGFPTTRLEQWRFTSVAPIAERTFALASNGVGTADSGRTAPLSTPVAHVVCVNGRFAPSLSSVDKLPKGVQVLSLEAALTSNPALVEPYLAKLSIVQNSAFTSLNTAFLRDGVVVLVAPGVVLEQPIELVFSSVSEGSGSVSHPRLLIVAGESSQATVLERYVGTGATFTNAVGEVWLGANAAIDHYKLQEEPSNSFHIASMFLHSARNGNFSSHSLTFGGGLVRNDVVATLDGEGIDCTLNGLYVGRDKQLIDNHTTIDHAMPHCGSHEIYKGILAEHSRAVFNGTIIVRPDAQKTDAKQTNKALLLSDDANINTKPELEIFANDVKCTHGAAIGQLDEIAMFYLRSRGLGVADARAMLVHAFAGDILNRVKIAPVREYLEGILTARLPHVE
ncbi:MAG TPA: Fe-S cluster assembly protein SufD [Vicinamibacterales bacterium]|nr:Fe-S cluster assembly protein SufD [Vicinamibacterales bacterium]